MRETSLPQASSASGSAIAYNLAGIALIVLLLAIGAAYLVDRLGHERDGPTPLLDDGDAVTQTISGRELTIPRNWFRFGEQLRDGFTSQIDLAVMIDTGEEAAAQPVNVTLVPRSRARTSASLLDAVYLHQFSDETTDGVPGLVGKPMAAGNGYRDETVWYDAISPNPFVAKCLVTVPGATSQCVRTVYLPSGIAAVYSFDATLLESWRNFDRQMEQWLTPIGAWSP